MTTTRHLAYNVKNQWLCLAVAMRLDDRKHAVRRLLPFETLLRARDPNVLIALTYWYMELDLLQLAGDDDD